MFSDCLGGLSLIVGLQVDSSVLWLHWSLPAVLRLVDLLDVGRSVDRASLASISLANRYQVWNCECLSGCHYLGRTSVTCGLSKVENFDS